MRKNILYRVTALIMLVSLVLLIVAPKVVAAFVSSILVVAAVISFAACAFLPVILAGDVSPKK